ncbi:hypothetical protein [Nitrosomonas nitrosa]|uniref:hypothetical protein n=1 Tax=Nitrosomonas nitrosa TaxID=52442 RepID=UPI000D2FEFEB|nr:hypothetical protein [Nitrosomonas nitrosa]
MFLVTSILTGCAALIGAGAAGGAYEYQNKQQLNKLEEDLKSGNIDYSEYLKRKKLIEEGSIIY